MDEVKGKIGSMECHKILAIEDLETLKSALQPHEDSSNDISELLHLAVKHGRLEIVIWLLENLFIPLEVNDKVVSLAVEENNEQMVRFLLQQSSTHRIYPLCESLRAACTKQHENIVSILLEYGARFVTYGLLALDVATRTAIVRLVENDRKDIFEMLLDNHSGLSLEVIVKAVSSFAIGNGKIEIIQMIISRVSRGDDYFLIKSMFYTALASRNREIVRLVIRRDVDSVTLHAQTHELSDAIEMHQLDKVLFLLECGVDVNGSFRYKKTYLDQAVTKGFQDIVEILLNCGADVNFKYGRFLLRHRDIRQLESLKVIVKYIVERLDEGGFVEEQLLREIARREDLSSFKDQCEKEIEKTKAHKFTDNDTDVSLYEVWKSDLIQLPNCWMYEGIQGSLQPEKLRANFPIYAGRIINKLKKGFERKFCETRVCMFFHSLSIRKEHQLPRLPEPCVKEIFDLLSTEDLINLRNSYYPKQTSTLKKILNQVFSFFSRI